MAPSFFLRHHAAMKLMRLFLLFLFLALTACATLVSQRIERADQIAHEAGMVPVRFDGELPLFGYARPGEGALWVFIEGDGLAWITPTRPSMNPTPLDPIALRLAAIDPADNVLYLGRPGQYVDGRISSRYWLGARFAPEVVTATSDAVLAQASNTGASEVVLVGYSGGGAIAALVAAGFTTRSSLRVIGLVTVAGNLDHQRWTEGLGLSPLDQSLNPADVAAQLASVPQRHLVGTLDKQVPGYVLDSYRQRAGDDTCMQWAAHPVTHAGPWQAVWLQARREVLGCEP